MGSMTPPLKAAIVLDILLLEDNDEDALLVERALRRAGFAYSLKRARNRSEFIGQLEPAPDLVLSDYHLPDFDAVGALDHLKERGLDVPLILVSGLARDEEVLEAVRRGAADFLSKDRLVRLAPAITATLEHRALRQQAREIQQALERDREELDFTFDNAAIGIALTTLDGRWLRVNRALARITGYTEPELLATDCHSITHRDDIVGDIELLEKLVAGEVVTTQREKRYVHKLGHVVWVQVTASLVRDREGKPRHRMLQVLDITQRKEVEERLQATFDQAAVGIAHTTTEGRVLQANHKLGEMLGYPAQALCGMTTRELAHPDDRDRQDALRLELLSGSRRAFSGEKRCIHADGRVIWVNRTVTLAHPAAGGEPYLIQVFEDITERKLAEQALHQSREQYAGLVETMDGIVWEADARTFRFLYVSPQAERILGYPVERWTTEPAFWKEHIHPEDRDGAVAYCATATREMRPHEFEYRMIAADGRAVWLRDTVTVIVEDGRPARLRGVMADITAGKQAEDRLKHANRARRVIAECNHVQIHAAGETEMLERMCRILVESGGYKMAWVGLATDDSMRPVYPAAYTGFGDDAPMTGSVAWDAGGRYRGFMHEVITTGTPHIARNILTDPAYARRRARAIQHGFQSSIALPLRGDGRILGAIAIYAREPDVFDADEIALLTEMAGDIAFGVSSLRARAAREKAEAALRESERRFREIFEQAAVGLTRADLGGVLVEANQKFCDMLGYSREELLGKTIRDITHPEDYGRGARYRESLAQGPRESVSGEKRLVRKDGSVIWVRRSLSTACDEAGRPKYVISVVEDITERKEAAERYRATFDNAPVGIMHTDLESGRILHANSKLCEMFGYTHDELLGATTAQITHADYVGADVPKYWESMLKGDMSTFSSERLYRRKDGSTFWGNRTVSLARDAAGRPLYFLRIIEDISERKRAEETLARARALLRTIIDTLPDRIYVKDREGRFLLENAANLKVHGVRDQDEIIGKTVFDLFPREVAERLHAEDQAVIETGNPILNRERSTPGPSGAVRWHVTTKVPLRDAAGNVLGVVGVNRDITERKQAEETVARERALLRTIIDTLPDHVYVKDPDGRFRLCNESWLNARGVTLEEITGKTVFDVFPREMAEEMAAQDRAIVETGAPLPEHEQKVVSRRREGKPGEVRWSATTKVPMRDAAGNVIGIVGLSRDVTERKEAEDALRVSEETLRATFNQASVGIIVTTPDMRFLQVNDKYCEIVGYAREELLRLTVRDVLDAEGLADAVEIRNKLVSGELQHSFREKQLVRRDGSRVWVALSASVILDSDGKPRHFVTVTQDISERKRAEAALRESEEQFRQLANNIPQAFWITDVNQKETLYVSPAAEGMIGRSLREIHASPRVLIGAVHREDRPRVHEARKAAAAGGYDQTYRVVRPDGSIRWVHDRAFPVSDDSGRVYRIVGIAEDVTDRKLAEERLMHLAHYDVLTSLPNRVLFYDRLRQVLAQARRNQWIVGVMFIDVDRFKNVNDTLGHAAGDQLLRQVAERLTGSVRSGDTVGRLGSDEFAVVLSNLSSAQDANLVVQKIMASFNEPFKLEGAEIYVTASIGITLYPDDSTDQDTLIKNADAAMYRAKEAGRNSYQFYTPEMNARALEVLNLENSLRRALDRNEFLLHYQPKAGVADGAIVGVEALLRWKHPERGLVSPVEFISVLEETGLIVPVGAWVLNAVCAQIRAWEGAGIKVPPVAVNLSARQFNSRDLGPMIRRALEEHRVDPSLIELEITESSLMANTEEAVRTLEYLERLGVRLAIDDFGTGYSSLGYLKRFPLDALKIDRSFIRDITTDGDDAAITRAVISLAHSLGLKVVAEGVETQAQLAFLAEHGCDEIQGYYFSRPLEKEECGKWLKERRRMHRPAPASGAPVVLLVDDDDDALTLFQRSLGKDGYRILTAGSAHEALEVLGQHRVDVVISDQNMPGVSGVDFLQRVKALFPRTVRMMTSGYTDFQSVADAVNKGEIFRFLPKNLSEDRLRADIREALLHLRAESSVQSPEPRVQGSNPER